MNQSDLPNPPRLHRRQTRTHPNNSPPKLAFNFKKLKELLCCHLSEKVDWNKPNERINNKINQTQTIEDCNSLKPKNSGRRPSRRSIRAAISERKEMENMLKEGNNQLTDGSMSPTKRSSRLSISGRPSSVGLTSKETDKQWQREFRKQTRMNTANNLRRNSMVGEKLQMELRRTSQLRRGSRAEVSSDMWEKMQNSNIEKTEPKQLRVSILDREPVRIKSGVSLALNNHSIDEMSENQEPSKNRQEYTIGVASKDETQDNYNDNENFLYSDNFDLKPNKNTSEQQPSEPNNRSILKRLNSSSSIQSNDHTCSHTSNNRNSRGQSTLSINSALLAASYCSKLQDKTRKNRGAGGKRRSSIAFGDETTVHYDKHDRNYDRRGSFLHQQSRSILNIPVIEEGETINEEEQDEGNKS